MLGNIGHEVLPDHRSHITVLKGSAPSRAAFTFIKSSMPEGDLSGAGTQCRNTQNQENRTLLPDGVAQGPGPAPS